MVERGDQPEAESGGAALCRVCGGEEGPCLASTFPACFSLWRCLCVPWCPVTWFSLALVGFTLWKESSFSHLSLRVDWNQLYSQPPPKIKNNFRTQSAGGCGPLRQHCACRHILPVFVGSGCESHKRYPDAGERMPEEWEGPAPVLGLLLTTSSGPISWSFDITPHCLQTEIAWNRDLQGQWEAWSLV